MAFGKITKKWTYLINISQISFDIHGNTDTREKTAQNNFSSQNFCVENNYFFTEGLGDFASKNRC